jgi:hypothetical protein
MVIVHPHPLVATIVGAVQTTVLGLDKGVDAVGIRPRRRCAKRQKRRPVRLTRELAEPPSSMPQTHRRGA